jgi:hypothetical protein
MDEDEENSEANGIKESFAEGEGSGRCLDTLDVQVDIDSFPGRSFTSANTSEQVFQARNMVWIGGQRLRLLYMDQHQTRRFEYEFTCHTFPKGTHGGQKNGAEFSKSPTRVRQLFLRPRGFLSLLYVKSISLSDI